MDETIWPDIIDHTERDLDVASDNDDYYRCFGSMMMREVTFDTDDFANSEIIEKVNFFNSENSFVLDFEATTHVCNDKFLFDEIRSTSVKIS